MVEGAGIAVGAILVQVTAPGNRSTGEALSGQAEVTLAARVADIAGQVVGDKYATRLVLTTVVGAGIHVVANSGLARTFAFKAGV